MTKPELKEEIKALKKLNAAYKCMLMKVQKYGLPLSKSESLINNEFIKEEVFNRKKLEKRDKELKKEHND